MRSNASSVTCADGIAPHQLLGSRSQPRVFAASMKPPMGMLTPRILSSIGPPWMKAGNESPRLKAAQSAGLGAKVLVSCW